MGKIKVSDYIIKFIQSKGVNDVFMFPGGGCIHLVDSVKKNNMNYVINLH
jgi:acetolactate synthase-1/2/3 large subunit